MAKYELGASGGDLADLVARANAAGRANEELKVKEEARAGVEEKVTAVEQEAGATRSSVAAITRDLTSAVSADVTALTAEARAVDLNTQAWERNAAARQTASRYVPGLTEGGRRTVIDTESGSPVRALSRGHAPTPSTNPTLYSNDAKVAAAAARYNQLETELLARETAAIGQQAAAPAYTPVSKRLTSNLLRQKFASIDPGEQYSRYIAEVGHKPGPDIPYGVTGSLTGRDSFNIQDPKTFEQYLKQSSERYKPRTDVQKLLSTSDFARGVTKGPFDIGPEPPEERAAREAKATESISAGQNADRERLSYTQQAAKAVAAKEAEVKSTEELVSAQQRYIVEVSKSGKTARVLDTQTGEAASVVGRKRFTPEQAETFARRRNAYEDAPNPNAGLPAVGSSLVRAKEAEVKAVEEVTVVEREVAAAGRRQLQIEGRRPGPHSLISDRPSPRVFELPGAPRPPEPPVLPPAPARVNYGVGGGQLADLVARAQAASQVDASLREREAQAAERTAAAPPARPPRPPVRPPAPAAPAEPEPDPGRYQAALRSQAEAEAARARASSAYTASIRPSSGAGLGEQTQLLEQREAAAQTARAAQEETKAARAAVELEQQVVRAKAEQLAEQQRVNAALALETRATAQAAALAQAAAVSGAGVRVGRPAPLQLAAGSSDPSRLPVPFPGHGAYEEVSGYAYDPAPPRPPLGPPQGQLGAGASQLLLPQSTRPGSSDAFRTAQRGAYEAPAEAGSQATRAETEAAGRARAHAADLAHLAEEQRNVNRAVNEAGAAYASSSQVLTRNGALTTEFIQAFARGQVTLKEFESQMVSTIGKFGGWAVAAGLVYGAYEALKQLGRGATETQTAVQNVGRFIPGLGGPAGGGKGQVNALESSVRDISTQFNVPIKEVGDAMQVMARRFHDVANAAEATRAVLAVSRLDQVPQAQSEQYLVGIANSLSLNKGSDLTGIVNSLNSLQSQSSARVSQTLPGLARAAPAAVAGGLDTPTLTALVGLGVTSGQTGNQVGTALLRSITTFSTRPASEAAFQRYGITSTPGDYKGLIDNVFRVIDTGKKTGKAPDGSAFSKTDIHDLAIALGGPQLGGRTLVALLGREYSQPGTLDKFREDVTHPRPYQEDLSAVLGSVGERFKSIGIGLENFGSRLAQAGALQPLIAGLDVVSKFTHVVEALLNPLTNILGGFQQLPHVVQDIIGGFLAFKLAQKVYGSQFGSTAQGFVGRLPGLSGLDTAPREVIRGTVARLETYQLAPAVNQQEQANAKALSARYAQAGAQERLNQFAANNVRAPEGTARAEAYDKARGNLQGDLAATGAKAEQAERAALLATERVAQTKADIAVLTDGQYSTAQKINYIQNRELAVEKQIVNVQEERLAEMRALISTGNATTAGRSSVQESVAAAGTASSVGAPGIAAAAAAAAAAPAVVAAAARGAGGAAGPSPFTSLPPVAPGLPPRVGLSPEAEAARGAQAARYEQTGALAGLLTRGQAQLESASQRIASIREGGVSGALGRVNQLGQRGALVGLVGSQAIGGAVGGGAGEFVTNVGGSAATGLLLADLLKKSPAAGLAIGTIAGAAQNNGKTGAIASGAGGLIGAGIGGLLGAGVFSVPGALVGGAIGTAVGALGAAVFGGDNKGGPLDAQNKAAADAKKATDLAARNATELQKFGDQFNTDLSTAFTGTGAAASTAQQKVQATISRLTAQISLFGSDSKQGKQAQAALSTVVSGALSQAAVDPAQAQQVLQAALAPKQKAVTDQFTLSTSQATDPGQSRAAYDVAATALDKAQSATFGGAFDRANQDLAGAQRLMAAAIQKGSANVIKAAKQNLKNAQATADAAAGAARNAGEANLLAKQAEAATAYQQGSQTIASKGTLSVADAGGNQANKLAAQLATAQQGLGLAQSYGGALAPGVQADEVRKYQAQIEQLQGQQAQQGLTAIQSQNKLGASKLGVGASPVDVARQQYQGLLKEYQYVQANASAFDPNQISDLLAQVNVANTAVGNAARQYATQIAGLHAQLAQARDSGNGVAQAQDAMNAAQVALANASNPQERLAAQVGIAQAANQQQAAGLARVKAQAALAASQTSDPLAKLRAEIAGASQVLSATPGVDARLGEQTNLNNLKTQYQQALVSQRESTINFQLSMQQITTQQAISQLNGLLKLKNLTISEQQNIQSRVRALQQGPGSGGSYDFAPGSIKLPTLYDVNHGLGIGQGGHRVQPQGATINASATNSYIINVHSPADVPLVVDAIDRSTGSQLHARLRSHGLRGT